MPDLPRPFRLLATTLACSLCFSAVSLPVVAQSVEPAAVVEVRDVTFRTVRPDNGGDAWLEAVVELNVRGTPEAGPYSRFVDRVRVTLSVGIETREGDYDFFRATAEAVSLRSGRASIRFYLPPEIMSREQLNANPYAYFVDLAVRGRPLRDGPGNASSVLRSAEIVSSFKDRVVRAAPLNDGVFVPQFDSPFEHSYGNDTPSFVRRPR